MESEVTIWPSGKHYGKLIVMNLFYFEDGLGNGSSIDFCFVFVFLGFLFEC